MPTLEEVHGKEDCHICHKPKAGPSGVFCSYPHGMVPHEEVKPGMWSWKLPDHPITE